MICRAVVVVALGALAGCGDATTPAAPASTSIQLEVPPSTVGASTLALPEFPDDLILDAEDFGDLEDMTVVDGLFVDNRLGNLDDALAVARGERAGPYPPGTILQVVPTEAMVKRRAGFDRASGDWEFFVLDRSGSVPVVVERGGHETTNLGGATCMSCHSLAAPESDFVCHGDPGCPELQFPPPAPAD